MAHYRKIDVAIWNDSAFMSLKPTAKLAFFMLITHPNMTSLGAMRANCQGLAAEAGVSAKEFSEVFDVGLAQFDDKANCIFVKNFLRYQSVESPNVAKSWVKQIQFIPECKLKEIAIDNMIAFLEASPKAFGKAFDEAYSKAFGKVLREGLSLAFREVMPDTVNSKQLAVNKTSLAKTNEGVSSLGKQAIAIDPDTGEVLSWAA